MYLYVFDYDLLMIVSRSELTDYVFNNNSEGDFKDTTFESRCNITRILHDPQSKEYMLLY